MKVLITGRTGSGCQELLSIMEQEGFPAAKGIYSDTADTADIILVKPDDIEIAAKLYPEDSIYIGYLSCSQNARLEAALEDGMSEAEFRQISKSESRGFEQLEKWLRSSLSGKKAGNCYPSNVTACGYISQDRDIDNAAETLSLIIRRQKNCAHIVQRCIEMEILSLNHEGIECWIGKNGKKEQKRLPKDLFVDMVLSDEDCFAQLLDAYLAREDLQKYWESRSKRKMQGKKSNGFEQLTLVFN